MNDPANLHNDEARCLGERLASRDDGACLGNMGEGFLGTKGSIPCLILTLFGTKINKVCCPTE